MKNYFSIFLVLLFIILQSCNHHPPNPQPTNPQESIKIPDFNADSAHLFVAAQTAFGPRVPNSEAHRLCGSYLVHKMLQYSDTVFQQLFVTKAYTGEKLQAKNIIASFNLQASKRLILASHWDSRPFADHDPDPANRNKAIDGANDGASGVGVLIEVARQLQIIRPEIGVDIIFFDAEDFGTPESENLPGDWWCLGAQYWAKNPHVAGYHADYGILLDMVGATGATFYHEGISSYYAQNIVSKVWGKANKLGFGSYFINNQYHPVTDDHYYVNTLANIPMIDILHQDKSGNTGFYPYWHTTQDNIDKIDKVTLRVVGVTLLSVIRDEK
jgi:Zn-dependent M28 family amino/carboxypeptidase